MSSQFIGRGEVFTGKVLELLFPDATVIAQYPIKTLAKLGDMYGIEMEFSEEIWKHKFDFLVSRPGKKFSLIVEVNYKHGEKADKKWNNIFKPLLLKLHLIPVTIDDWECKALFKKKKNLNDIFESVFDVFAALERAGIKK